MKKILSLVLGLMWTLPVWGANCNLFDISQSPTTENISSNLIWTRYNINVSSTSLSVGNWTAKHTDFISPGTYTITFNGTNSSVAIRGYDGSNLSVLRRGNGSFTITNPTQIWIFVADPETMARITEIMLERGSTATAYQPYNATCDDRCKNLFDKAQTPYNSGVYISSATVGQTGFELSSNSNYDVYRVEIQPSTTYTFGLIKATSPKWVVTDANNVVLDTGANNGGEAGNSITITTGATAKYLYLSVSVNEKYKCIDILQLELGDTATEYVPYNAACHNNKIKIATTKYNETKFSPLNTALANAISVVDTVVSNTITQAGRIATLQAQKQTRPADDTCPAYKQCLLVEDENGTPHWYEITDPFRDFVTPIIANNVAPASTTNDAGYTQLEYIRSDGASWIDTGITGTQDTAIETKFINLSSDSSTTVLIGDGWSNGAYLLSIVAQTGAPNRIGGLNNTLRDFWRTGQEFVVKMDKTGLYVNNSKINWKGSATNFTTTKPLYLLGDPAASNRISAVKLFYMKIYNNGTLVRNFIPAKRNSDGAIGMYDTVSKTFFANAGTGTFTAGPTVANTDVPANGTWTATWTANATTGVAAGTVYGEGLCNATEESTVGKIATDAQMSSANWNTTGSHCWCKIDSIDIEGSDVNTTTNKWVWITAASGCLSNCSYYCANSTKTNQRFRNIMLNTAQ